MKKTKTHKETHTINSKYGTGDYYGSGIKQPIGRIRESQIEFRSAIPKNLKKAPKALA